MLTLAFIFICVAVMLMSAIATQKPIGWVSLGLAVAAAVPHLYAVLGTKG
jgi:hypothetical protein